MQDIGISGAEPYAVKMRVVVLMTGGHYELYEACDEGKVWPREGP